MVTAQVSMQIKCGGHKAKEKCFHTALLKLVLVDQLTEGLQAPHGSIDSLGLENSTLCIKDI